MLRALLFFVSLTLVVQRSVGQDVPTIALAGQSDAKVAPAAAPATEKIDTEKIYNIAEEMPQFPGGDAEFIKFLRNKIEYPAAALEKGVSGKVHVSFVVDEKGRIQDAKVVKGLGHGLDEEALRLVRIMPWWTPGKIGGQPVRVAYTMPIVFRALE